MQNIISAEELVARLDTAFRESPETENYYAAEESQDCVQINTPRKIIARIRAVRSTRPCWFAPDFPAGSHRAAWCVVDHVLENAWSEDGGREED